MHNRNDGENNCGYCGGGKENMPRWSLKRHRQRSGKKNQPEGYQRELRGYIEKTIRDISRDDRSRVRAARDPYCEPGDVTADYRWKKKRTEEPARVTLRARRETELRAGGIHHDMPLGDAACQCDKIN